MKARRLIIIWVGTFATIALFAKIWMTAVTWAPVEDWYGFASIVFNKAYSITVYSIFWAGIYLFARKFATAEW